MARLQQVLGTLSSATALKFSTVDSSIVEMLYLDISPANFTNFGAAWTEVDSGSNVNVSGGVLTLNGNNNYATNGMIGPALTLANGYFEYVYTSPLSSVTPILVAGLNSAAAIPASASGTPGAQSISSLVLRALASAVIMGGCTVATSTSYTIRQYILTPAEGTLGKKFKITIQGGIYSTETTVGEYAEVLAVATNPFYPFFQRYVSNANLTTITSPKWFSGYSTAAPYVEYVNDAGAGKVFDNFDPSALALPGTVPSTNLTFKWSFDDGVASYSSALTLAQLNAVGKQTARHRYIRLQVLLNSDGATQVYAAMPNSATATDGVGDFPEVANVFSNDTVQTTTGTGTAPAAGKVMADAGNFGPGAATTPTLNVGNVRDTVTGGTLSSDKILKSNATGSGAGNYNNDNITVANVRPVAFGIGQTGDLSGLQATDAAYVSLENSRNNDNGTVAADITTGKSVKIRNVTINGSGSGGGGVPAPGIPALGTPTALSSTSLRVYFTWSTDAEKIYLERSTDGVTYGAGVEMAAGAYYYDDTGLTAGTAYTYRARAWNTTGYSAYSTTVQGTTRTTNGIEQALWSTFKTKMQADTYLAGYIGAWKFDLEEKILTGLTYPIFKAWIASTREEWMAVPKRKSVVVRLVIHGLVRAATPALLEVEKLKMDEYIKNAVESDMTFDDGTTMNIVGDTIFSNKSDSEAEVFVEVELMSLLFTAGAR